MQHILLVYALHTCHETTQVSLPRSVLSPLVLDLCDNLHTLVATYT
jgi:hypothetical protein